MNANVSLAVKFLRHHLVGRPAPRAALILGSGLGDLAQRIENSLAIAYDKIPGMVASTARGHQGELIFGTLQSVPLVAMAGRFHRYEGWTNDQICFPVTLMHALGASCLIVSNAAGAVSPKLAVGDIVILRDHMNGIGGNPASPSGSCRGRLYDLSMARAAQRAALEAGFAANSATYLATLGPTYETRAEYRMMRRMGADVVGMSTVPEVLEASALGMRVLGLSMVSNVANPDCPTVASHAEVLQAGKAAAAKMEAIVRGVLAMPCFRRSADKNPPT